MTRPLTEASTDQCGVPINSHPGRLCALPVGHLRRRHLPECADPAFEAAAVARALAPDRVAAALHELPAGEALHEDYWAMRYPSGTQGKGAECPPCVSAARDLIAALTEGGRG